MSPGCKPGHLALAGNAFFANGNVVGLRKFNSRTFRIDVGAGTPIADTDCGSRPDDPGPQVGPLKMEDMRQLFQRRQ